MRKAGEALRISPPVSPLACMPASQPPNLPAHGCHSPFPQVAHAWRTTFDSHPSWPSIMLNLDESVALARYAGPGAWNDLDLLEVGAELAGMLSWQG